jgi:tetratricopeptide (TPR) repeat protein
LAVTLRRRGQEDQARRLLEGNLKRFSTHADSLVALLDLLEKSAGVPAAKDFVKAHGKRHAESPEVANVEARWSLDHAEPEHALGAYRRALTLNPSFFPAVLALSQFYARRDRSNLAHSVLDGALAHSPKDLRLLLLAARLTGDLRRYDQAREYAERALQHHPDHPLALAELAILHAEGFRDLTRARELSARAYAGAPARPEVLDALGWVSHLGGDPARALVHLEPAAREAPENPRVLYHLGAALLGAGQVDAAHAKLALVLSLDPSFPTAREIHALLSPLGPHSSTARVTARSRGGAFERRPPARD